MYCVQTYWVLFQHIARMLSMRAHATRMLPGNTGLVGPTCRLAIIHLVRKGVMMVSVRPPEQFCAERQKGV